MSLTTRQCPILPWAVLLVVGFPHCSGRPHQIEEPTVIHPLQPLSTNIVDPTPSPPIAYPLSINLIPILLSNVQRYPHTLPQIHLYPYLPFKTNLSPNQMSFFYYPLPINIEEGIPVEDPETAFEEYQAVNVALKAAIKAALESIKEAALETAEKSGLEVDLERAFEDDLWAAMKVAVEAALEVAPGVAPAETLEYALEAALGDALNVAWWAFLNAAQKQTSTVNTEMEKIGLSVPLKEALKAAHKAALESIDLERAFEDNLGTAIKVAVEAALKVAPGIAPVETLEYALEAALGDALNVAWGAFLKAAQEQTPMVKAEMEELGLSVPLEAALKAAHKAALESILESALQLSQDPALAVNLEGALEAALEKALKVAVEAALNVVPEEASEAALEYALGAALSDVLEAAWWTFLNTALEETPIFEAEALEEESVQESVLNRKFLAASLWYKSVKNLTPSKI